MSKKIICKKLIFINLIFIISFCFNSFSYEVSKVKDVYDWAIYSNSSNTFSYTKNFTLENVNVVRTQDENYFYFDINADAKLNENLSQKFIDERLVYDNGFEGMRCVFGDRVFTVGKDLALYCSIGEKKSLVPNRLKPVLYKENNFTDKVIKRYGYTDTSNGGKLFTLEHSLYIGSTLVSRFYYTNCHSATLPIIYNEKKSIKFFMPYGVSEMTFGFGDSKLLHPNTGEREIDRSSPDTILKTQEGFTLISNSCKVKNVSYHGHYIKSLTYELNSKIKIEKKYIDDYRYFAFAGLTFINNYDYINDFISEYSLVFSSTNTIDLKSYADCEHKWVYLHDMQEHKKVCENCKWEINENHNFIYEYDGMNKNMCICGYNKNVNLNYIINDDLTNIVICNVKSDSNVNTVEYNKKTGYKFLYYEKYEKVVIDKYSEIKTSIKEKLVATLSSIPKKVENLSTTYKAIYEPITYNIEYSLQNNKNIVLNEINEIQKIKYDEIARLYKGEESFGYNFMGWTDIKNGKEVKYKANQEIKNWSSKENETFILYPIYEINNDEIYFTINYKTKLGEFSNNKKELSKKYYYNELIMFEKIYNLKNNQTHFSYWSSEYGKIKNIYEFKKLVNRQNMIFNLNANFRNNEYGASENTEKETIKFDINDIENDNNENDISENEKNKTNIDLEENINNNLFIDSNLNKNKNEKENNKEIDKNNDKKNKNSLLTKEQLKILSKNSNYKIATDSFLVNNKIKLSSFLLINLKGKGYFIWLFLILIILYLCSKYIESKENKKK